MELLYDATNIASMDAKDVRHIRIFAAEATMQKRNNMYKYQVQDPRIIESRKLISESFLQLLKKDSFEEITVTQICQEAQIARGTFYRNFDTKYDVIKYILIQDVARYQKQGYAPRDMQDAIADFFRNMPYSKTLLKSLLRNQMFYMFHDIYTYWEQTYDAQKGSPFPPKNEYDDYQREFLTSVPVGILKVWTARNFRETPQELAIIWERIMHQVESV